MDERSGLKHPRMLIREHPWLGVGYGNFTLALFQRRPPAMEAYPVYQPVHRTPLLALAEIGLPGALIGWRSRRGRGWRWRQRRTWLAARALSRRRPRSAGRPTMVGFFDFTLVQHGGAPLMWITWLLAQSLASQRLCGLGCRWRLGRLPIGRFGRQISWSIHFL
jgi:hypothetical protein